MAIHIWTTPQYYYKHTAPVSAEPFSLGVRFYKEARARGAMVSLYTNGQTNNYRHTCMAISAGYGNAQSRDTVNSAAQTVNQYSITDWNSLICMFVASNDRRAVLNDGTIATNATNRVVTFDSMAISARAETTIQQFNAGYLAEVAVWDIAPVPAWLITAFNNGYSPKLLEPSHLVSWVKCLRGDTVLYDLITGEVFTKVGVPSTQPHPMIFYPTKGPPPKIHQEIGARMEIQEGTDTHLQSDFPDTNYEDSTILRVGNDITVKHYKSIIDFNLEKIPGCAIIKNAYLELYCESVPAAIGQFAIHLLAADAILDECTWNDVAKDVPWPNGAGVSEDFAQEPYWVQNNPVGIGLFTVTNLRKHVQDCLRHYNKQLRLFFRQEGTLANTHLTIESFNSATSANWPKLTIEYLVPDAVQIHYRGKRSHYTCAKFRKSDYT